MASIVLLAASVACKAQTAAPSAADLKSEDEKTLYALGAILGKNVAPLKVTEAELRIIQLGLGDAAAGRPLAVPFETYGPKVQAFAQARATAATTAAASPEKEKGKAYADNAAKEAGAVRTPSGLVFRHLAPGQGAKPTQSDSVRVHYRGTLIDGTEFDSSIKRGMPIDFALKNVIPCWTEGLTLMQAGGKAQLVCPSDIAYGDRGQPPSIPPGATLVFEVELLDVIPAKPVTR
jgi:FKBP-type peptidyl-prolyl cis-trans isomerase FkpA